MTGIERPQLVGRVLIVDDHARARQSMGDILSCAGHQVACCASAVEALRQLEQTAFDVIITDLQMPGMNGLELIKALQQRGEEAQIVMVTAHASVSSAVEAMRHGAFDYIEKPFNADQIEQLVCRALRRGGAAASRSTVPADGDCRGRDDRLQPRHADAATQDTASGTDGRDRADHRRKRCGQGTRRARRARGQPPGQQGAGQPELPRPVPAADGERVVRTRTRRVHQRRRTPRRPL